MNVKLKTCLFAWPRFVRICTGRFSSILNGGSYMGTKTKHIWYGPEFQRTVPNESFGKQIYKAIARASPDEVIFIDAVSGKRTTYVEFLTLCCRLARSLQNYGYKANDVVAVSGENNEFYFVPIVASLFLGMISAPLNQSYTTGELTHMMNISQPKIIFCTKSSVQPFIQKQLEMKFIDKIIVMDGETSSDTVQTMPEFINEYCEKNFCLSKFEPEDLDPMDHIATILCSSGTTGLPKGVMITHDNISTRYNQLMDSRLNGLKHEIYCTCLPFFHAFGYMNVVAGIPRKSTYVIMQRFEEELFLKTIGKYKVNVSYIVPPIGHFLANSTLPLKYDLSSLKELLIGAAPLSRAIETTLRNRFPALKELRQGYGLTEGTITLTLMPSDEIKLGSSGKVVPGVLGMVRDIETGKVLGPNQTGELCFKGRMVTKGYYRNPEATRSTYIDGWLYTGDLGYFDEEGFIYIVDRLKELIKYKGFQVAPAELEGILLKQGKIKDVAVIGKPDEIAGELPTAFVVKNPGSNLDEEEIIDFVAGQVSKPKRLHGGVYFVNAIPKTASGKILRRVLREKLIAEKNEITTDVNKCGSE